MPLTAENKATGVGQLYLPGAKDNQDTGQYPQDS